jgi:hypothetical protein
VTDDAAQRLIREMREGIERLHRWSPNSTPTDEADPATAEIIANLKRELESMRGALQQT